MCRPVQPKDPQFNLKVKRPGCEFDGQVTDNYGAYKDLVRSGTLLKKWFDNAPQAGYGDVRAQETKVDLIVRDAHEITKDEFEVESALLGKIVELWGKHFFPTRVRAEPYKINVYGPGGHFKPHKDTPEKNLVGTFLVGLGDSTPRQRPSCDRRPALLRQPSRMGRVLS